MRYKPSRITNFGTPVFAVRAERKYDDVYFYLLIASLVVVSVVLFISVL